MLFERQLCSIGEAHLRGIIRFLKRALRNKRRLADDPLLQLAAEIVGHARMVSLILLPDPATEARTVGVDVDDLAFRLRETTGSVTAALVLLEKEGRASRTWMDGHWILRLRPQDMRRATSEGDKDRRTA
jgi:hypothetical protein